MACILALYAWSKYKDNKNQALEGECLQACKQIRWKKPTLIIFNFPLYNAQMKIIPTFFYKQKDLLLLAKIGFDKSLIF